MHALATRQQALFVAPVSIENLLTAFASFLRLDDAEKDVP